MFDDDDDWARQYAAESPPLEGAEWDDAAEDDGVDSLGRPRDVAAEAFLLAQRLTELRRPFLDWGEIHDFHRQSSFVDPQLTELLGRGPNPTWVVLYHSDDYVWTVARHQDEQKWTAFFGYGLPWDPDDVATLVEVEEEDLADLPTIGRLAELRPEPPAAGASNELPEVDDPGIPDGLSEHELYEFLEGEDESPEPVTYQPWELKTRIPGGRPIEERLGTPVVEPPKQDTSDEIAAWFVEQPPASVVASENSSPGRKAQTGTEESDGTFDTEPPAPEPTPSPEPAVSEAHGPNLGTLPEKPKKNEKEKRKKSGSKSPKDAATDPKAGKGKKAKRRKKKKKKRKKAKP